MASPSSIFYLFLLCVLVFIVSPSLSAASNEFPKSGIISIPVNIDPTTHQYFTSIGIGTPRHNIKFAIDLSGNFLWYECGSYYNSSSYNPVPCDSPQCPEIGSFCVSCDGLPSKPGCTNYTCSRDVPNPFDRNSMFMVDVGQDFLFTPQIKLPRTFASVCAETSRFSNNSITGLAKGVKGILGLAMTPLTLPFQISSSFNVPPKFTLCLPSSGKGQLFIGRGPSFTTPLSQIGFDYSYATDEYFIRVNSINVNDKLVKLNTSLLFRDETGIGGTKISTLITSPYTVLHHSIYQPFVKAFVRAAKARNMKRVKKVQPFGACYHANTIKDREVVPAIDLVMEGRFGKVNYDIPGHNSLVEVKKGVLCLAFVDGGKVATTGVVLGGHQLEDRILEFDLSTSIISFSSSFVLQNKTCSDPTSL